MWFLIIKKRQVKTISYNVIKIFTLYAEISVLSSFNLNWVHSLSTFTLTCWCSELSVHVIKSNDFHRFRCENRKLWWNWFWWLLLWHIHFSLTLVLVDSIIDIKSVDNLIQLLTVFIIIILVINYDHLSLQITIDSDMKIIFFLIWFSDMSLSFQ